MSWTVRAGDTSGSIECRKVSDGIPARSERSQRVEVHPPFGTGRKRILSSGRTTVRSSTWRANGTPGACAGSVCESGSAAGAEGSESSRRSVKVGAPPVSRASSLCHRFGVPAALPYSSAAVGLRLEYRPTFRTGSVQYRSRCGSLHSNGDQFFRAGKRGGRARGREQERSGKALPPSRRRVRAKRHEPLHRDPAAARLLRPEAGGAGG